MVINPCDPSVVVVAAGSGSRFGADCPKQFLDLDGMPVLRYSIDTFRSTLGDIQMVLVLSETGKDIWDRYCVMAGYSSPCIVYGGDTRGASVLAGLLELCRRGVPDDGIVMVHDGARPLLTGDLLRRLAGHMASGGRAVVPAVPLSDSIMTVCGGMATGAPDRSTMQAVQTPQCFRLGEIIQAHQGLMEQNAASTDECGAYIRHFMAPVEIVAGDVSNIKITNPADIEIAGAILKYRREKMCKV